MAMRYLTTAQDLGELAIIKGLCEVNKISCCFQHEHIGSLYPGCAAMQCRVLVEDDDWDRADTLIRRLRLPLREVEPSA